jgi:succinate dehydrogenase / fumarate reductase flavoprotein subunit
VCSLTGPGEVRLAPAPVTPMRPELRELFDRDELAKYFTPEELA